MGLVMPTLMSGSFVPADPMGSAYSEGRRSFAMDLLARVDRICPELLILARREEVDLAEMRLIERKKQNNEETIHE
jgi:hypothetical protein